MPNATPPRPAAARLFPSDFTAAEMRTPAAQRNGYPILTIGSNACECGECDGRGCSCCYAGLVPMRRWSK